MSDNPIMNIGDLAKPVTALIEKIADAGYILFGESYQIKQAAKAKAKAEIIEAESQIEITDLHRRAMRRWIEEEAQHQKNMEDITEKAIHQLNEDADPHAIDNGWIAKFFDITRLISDDEMQNMWANILAGEANNPGGCSIRTLNALKSIDKKEAEYFTKLCHFVVTVEREGSYFNFVPMILHQNDEIYRQNGINLGMLNHIQDDLGLIKLVDSMGGMGFFRNNNIPAEPIESLSITYHGKRLKLKVPKGRYRYRDGKARVDFGIANLTKVGFELCQICETKPINGFFEYMQTKLQDHINETLETK